MGLFNKLFGKLAAREAGEYFKALTAYTPVFTTFQGSLYEMELVRSAIHAIATSCSKLKPEMQGAAYKNLERRLQYSPNPHMNTSQFLYRVATIFLMDNNAFIAPLNDDYGRIIGYYPVLPSNAEVLEVNNLAYISFTFATGERAAIEYSKIGHLTQYQFSDDFFGSDNSPLKRTVQLIHTQNEGIENAVKNNICPAQRHKEHNVSRSFFLCETLCPPSLCAEFLIFLSFRIHRNQKLFI